MKKKIIIFFVTSIMLLALWIPSTISQTKENQQQFQTEEIVPLDTDLISDSVHYLSNIVMQKNPSGEWLYPKSRCFGTPGELLAKEYLVNLWESFMPGDVECESIIDPYDDRIEQVYHSFTLYTDTDTLQIQNSDCFPYAQKTEDSVVHQFIKAPIKIPPDDWFNIHTFDFSIENMNLQFLNNFNMEVNEVILVKNYENALVEELANKVHLLDTTSMSDSEIFTLIENSKEFKAQGLIFISDLSIDILNFTTLVPIIQISELDGEKFKDLLIEESEVYIDLFDGIKPSSDGMDFEVHFGSQQEFESLLLGGQEDSVLYLISQADCFNKHIYNRLKQHQDDNNIKVGYVMYDQNDDTHFMNPSKRDIPGISINGSTGQWIKDQLEQGKEVKADFILNQQFIESVQSFNIIGTIEGESEDLVIVEGHYDSMWGQFAIDNAVGASVVTGLAKYFADNKETFQPKYTLVFITFAGEEQGLKGSKSYIDSHYDWLCGTPIRCIINLDTFAHTLDIPFAVRFLSNGGISSFKLKNDFEQIFDDTNYDVVSGSSSGHEVVNMWTSIPNLLLVFGGRCDAGQFFTKLPLTKRPKHALLIDKYDVDDESNNQPFYQRSGEGYTGGDSLNILHEQDLAASSEVLAEIVKYFAGVSSENFNNS